MSKRNNRKFGLSRRLGQNVWGSEKDPVNTRNYPPGQHGRVTGYGKPTEYKTQLFAKQKLKGYYGNITEKQFRKIYEKAVAKKGDTGENLVGLLESRLDAVVYRAGFVSTVFASRQFINHKHIKVNGKVVNIASYRLRPGDVVEVAERSKQLMIVQDAIQSRSKHVPDYLAVDFDKLVATYNKVPELVEIPYPVVIEPHLVVEFYSR